jgi:hypothetical protein
VRSIGFYDASVEFSDATEGKIAKLPLKEEVYSEQNRGWRLRLQPFRGEDRFRIGAGNLAHRNPAEATNQRAD